MGRYYSTQHFDGKFGFGCQSSDDARIFGMYEEEKITFYLDRDEESLSNVKSVLDEQYNLLGVPKEKRLYEVRSNDEISDYIDSKEFDEYVFTIVSDEERSKDVGTLYSLGYASAIEKKPGAYLAKCRIAMGIRIYSELLLDGWCEMECDF